MEKVLITGCLGFVGPYLEKELKKKYEVFGLDKRQSERSNHFACDVLDKKTLRKYFSRIKPAFVYHLAGFSSVKESISSPVLARDINVIGTKNILDILKDTNIKLGAQNIYPKDEGAFTGEISPGMLKSCGVSFAIIGHSERRTYFNETDSFINQKIDTAINADLIPVLCIGESAEERESEKTFSVLDKQLEIGLEGFSKDSLVNLVIAYEPIWAIGTGKTATPEQAQEVHKYIRELLGSIFDKETASNTRIQYGGSVKPDNIKDLIIKEDVDGALVGGASLKIDSFVGIVKGAI